MDKTTCNLIALGVGFVGEVTHDKEAKIFVSYAPSFKIYSQGKSIQRALDALQDAVESYLATSIKHNLPIK